MAILLTDLIKQYGDYYIDGGQNEKDLRRRLFLQNSFAKNSTIIPTDNDIIRLGNVSVGELVQGFQKGWTPKGDVTIAPQEIRLEKMKVDFSLFPDDIEQSWAGFLASNDLDRSQWPLCRYLVEVDLLPKIVDDLERNVFYKGKKGAIVVGTAGASADSLDGIKQKLSAGLTAGTINALPATVFTKNTIYDQIEELYERIPEEYQNVNMNIYVSPHLHGWFLKDKRMNRFYDINGPGQIDSSLDFAPATVVPMNSMIGETDIFITPKENLIYGVKKSENMGRFRMEGAKREVAMYTDFSLGVGFAMNQAVWTTLQI